MSSSDKISKLHPNVVRGTKEILAGTFAGVIGTFFGHPLDLVKVSFFRKSENQN
jgi:hypothetical protein